MAYVPLLRYRIPLATVLAVSALWVITPAQADEGDAPVWAMPVAAWPKVSNEVSQNIKALLSDPSIKNTLEDIKVSESETFKRTIALTEIPAPPFKEEARAKEFMKMLNSAGLTDARIDKEGNVIALRKGLGAGPLVILDSHLDTVFPIETDVKVKERNGKYYAPGISDDTHGLSVLVSWAKILELNNIKTVGDLLFVGTVGEEGNGNLRGARALLKEYPNADAFIGFEPLTSGYIVPLNTGVYRYEVKYSGLGGHSFAAFGTVPSAIHPMGRAIANIANIKVPKNPRTTYNVGIVRGGRSVNTISPDAIMEIDMRSTDQKQLDILDKKIKGIINKSVEDENKFIGANPLTVTINKIGERAAGMTPNNSPLIQAALGSMRAMGQKEEMLIGGSTNAEVPISLNIPTIIISPGGTFEGFHALTEAMDPKDSYKGSQIALITALTAVGVQGVSKPVIIKKIK